MSDSSYGSVYVEGVTYIDEREIAKRDAEIERLLQGERAADAEIERLRGLLIRIGKRRRALAKLVCGERVPFGTNEALDAIERCVREALGERDD